MATIQSSGTDSAVQYIEGMHVGYRPQGVIHQRRIEFSPGNKSILIRDSLEGAGSQRLAIHFHFAPEIEIAQVQNGQAWLATWQRRTHCLRFEVDAAWRWEAMRGDESLPLGWYSSALGKKEPAVTLRGERGDTLPIQVCTRIVLVN